MHRTLVVSLACLATLVAGCGSKEGESEPEGSGKPPANMCEAVAPVVPKDWKLTKTSVGAGTAKTDCTLADETGRTHLIVGLKEPKSGSVDAAYKKLCDFYIVNAQEKDDERCTATGPIKLEGSPAQVQRGVRMDRPEAVLWLTFQTNDPDIAAGAEDVLDDVESALSEG